MYGMLADVQGETNGIYSMRQINEKLQQITNNWLEPLKNMKNCGYFSKRQGIQPNKITICELFGIDAIKPAMTNRDIKNKFNFRALKEYVGIGDQVWNKKQKCPLDVSFAVPQMTILDNFVEFKPWIKAMVIQHGQSMVGFMDACVTNAINSYIVEPISTGTNIAKYTFVTSAESNL
ncbi:hypothetical protein J3B02_004136 [Coemansia erecta]|nr:hypothetical protein J3B02_004136 [Coemansia erecta]